MQKISEDLPSVSSVVFGLPYFFFFLDLNIWVTLRKRDQGFVSTVLRCNELAYRQVHIITVNKSVRLDTCIYSGYHDHSPDTEHAREQDL